MAFELRAYQATAVDELVTIMKRYNLAYLAAMVRTGKNYMSFETAKRLGWKRVCFITKKSAFDGVKSDYAKWDHRFTTFDVFNFESSHKIHPIYDGFIIDEAHCIGAFPKPGKQCKDIHKLIFTKKSPCLLMSGTPSPETPSQLFHQLWVSPYTPFQGYGHRSGEFYGWAKEYVKIEKKYVNGFMLNDYKKADKAKIDEVLKHYMVNVSQQDAGFTSYVEEEIFWVDIRKELYQLMKVLKDHKIYRMKSGDYIVADTPARLQQCFHQISSGTIITGEEGSKKYHVLDESKAHFIKKQFAGKKIAIYYHFISEGDVLRRLFPNHTDNAELFNQRNDLIYIKQMISGSMGVNLSTTDWLVMYNIGFSAKTYWQVRARMQTMDRTKASKLAWIFSRNGIEPHVLSALQDKKEFTTDYFQRKTMKIMFNGSGVQTTIASPQASE
jgi:hypothetical protein